MTYSNISKSNKHNCDMTFTYEMTFKYGELHMHTKLVTYNSNVKKALM